MKNLVIPFLLLSILFSGCQKDLSLNDDSNGQEKISVTIDGYMRIKLNSDIQDPEFVFTTRGSLQSGISELDRVAEAIGASKIVPTFVTNKRFNKRHREHGLHLWYDVYFDESVPVTKAVTDFSQLSFVDVAEPVATGKLQSVGSSSNWFEYASRAGEIDVPQTRMIQTIFDDPYILSEQWHYNNTGRKAGTVLGSDINLFYAWYINSGHRDVIVAIMDGGISYAHEDLAGNMWINEAELNGQENVDDDDNGYLDDIYGFNFVTTTGEIRPHYHGTHVAGTVSAVNNNGIGVAGVAGGSGQGGARLMSCQFVQSNFGDVIRIDPNAYIYAADNGAVISQNSWISEYESQVFVDAIDYFIQYAGIDENGIQTGPMRGGVVIAASGNEGMENPYYPARLDNVITVGSIDGNFIKSGYSNYGSWVNLMAPGGQRNGSLGVYSTILNNLYGGDYGTSMACPHVSGVAALVISEFGVGKPGFTADDLKRILFETARNLDEYNPEYAGKIGYGLVDALAALARDGGVAPSAPAEAELVLTSDINYVRWVVPTDQNGVPTQLYRITVSDNIASDPSPLYYEVLNNLPADSAMLHIFPNLDNGKEYTMTIDAVDMFGNVSQKVTSKGVKPAVGEPNVVDEIYVRGIGEAYTTTIDMFEVLSDIPQRYITREYRAVSANTDIVTVATEGYNKIHITPVSVGTTTIDVTGYLLDDYSFTSTIKVVVSQSGADVSLYPNPVVDILNIRVSDKISGDVGITIYNSSGAKVYNTSIYIDTATPGALNLSKFKTGVYNISLNHNGKRYNHTFIKK